MEETSMQYLAKQFRECLSTQRNGGDFKYHSDILLAMQLFEKDIKKAYLSGWIDSKRQIDKILKDTIEEKIIFADNYFAMETNNPADPPIKFDWTKEGLNDL